MVANSTTETAHSSNYKGVFLSAENKSFTHYNLDYVKSRLESSLIREALSTEDQDILKKIISSLDGKVFDGINAHLEDEFRISPQEVCWLNLNPDKSWAEYLIFRYKFSVYPQIRKKTEFPIYLLIEPTSICNIRCVMCFQVDKSFTTKEHMGRMPFDLFKKIVDEAAANGTKAVTLASRGEPTLHKDFPQMLTYLSQKSAFLEIKINTNATRLTSDMSREILNSGVTDVVFSVDAGTKKTYEEIRVKGKFEQVVNNIKTFNEIRTHEYPNSRTQTRISGVKVRDDQDIEQMISFWSQHVDHVTIKPATPRWDTYFNEPNNALTPCKLVYERMYVWYDGTINPCDFDYKSKLAVGNLNDMTLKEAWNSENYKILRTKHDSGKRPEVFPCDRCTL